MKKTLITLLALGGLAMGDTTTTIFTDLSQDATLGGIVFTAASNTEFATITGDIYGTHNNDAAMTGAITLNLTAALAASTDVNLIRVDGSSGDPGLRLDTTNDRIVGQWEDGAYGSKYINLSDLKDSAYTVGDNQYVTLTFSFSTTWNDGGHGTQVYTNDGSNVYDLGELASSSNTQFNGIMINTDYIKSVAINPALLASAAGKDSTVAAAVGVALQTATVPEPTTATLSLLALAALAARRRRK